MISHRLAPCPRRSFRFVFFIVRKVSSQVFMDRRGMMLTASKVLRKLPSSMLHPSRGASIRMWLIFDKERKVVDYLRSVGERSWVVVVDTPCVGINSTFERHVLPPRVKTHLTPLCLLN